ncbi:MAG: hypothetical protein ACTHJM_07490 [Marmoricola sp.]
MSDPTDPLPTASRLPEDAQHLGLRPVTAPELQVAASLRSDKPLHKLLAWVALVAVLALVASGIITAFTR